MQKGKTDLQNPWNDPMSYNDEGSGTWGNGDGRFFYPPRRDPNAPNLTDCLDAPIDSLRWELLGAGVQDWEYFHMLSGLVQRAEASGDRSAAVRRASALLTVPKDICTDLKSYTRDPSLLDAHREKLARAIEELAARVTSQRPR